MSAGLDHLSTIESESLPSGWRAVTLEDLIADDGAFVDGDWVESKDQDPAGDVRLIQLADVGDGEYRDRSERFLTSQKAAELGCTLLEPGDLLVARMPDPLGRACIFPGDQKRSVTVVDVAIVRPRNPEVNTRWLMYCINAPQFRRVIASLQSGSTRQRISRKNLAKIVFPLPPVDWQSEVVDEIEKQFSRLDEAVANLKRVKANLKRYKAAVLKAAVEGRLVPTEAERARQEGRPIETAERFLQRIREMRRSLWRDKARYKEPVAPDPAGLPELPEGWVWVHLEQVSEARKHALKAGPFGSALKKEHYARSGYKVYGQEQVIRGDHRFGDYFIDDAKFRELESCSIKPGDLLLSLVGTAGRVLVVPNDAQPGIINPRLLKLSLNSSFISPAYAAYILQSSWVAKFFKSQAHGGTMEILNLGIVKALAVPLPPYAEQERIVSEIERLVSIAAKVQGQVAVNLQRVQQLRGETLARMFARGDGR